VGHNAPVVPPVFRAYAHRGGGREAAENSLAAFRHAQRLGYVYLETDVRPTRDGVAVVFHDATLDRTTDAGGRVRDLTWRDVGFVRLHDGSTPLRLEELLEEFPESHVTVDAKESGSVAAIADAVRRTGSRDRVCVTSFSARRLDQLRRLLPDVESGAHPREVLSLRVFGRPLPRATRVQVPTRAFGMVLTDASFLARAHRRGLAVDVWTIDDPDEMRRLLDLGVDGIMTDSPSLLLDVVAEWRDRSGH